MLSLAVPVAVDAQASPSASHAEARTVARLETREVSGRVLRPGGTAGVPIAGAWVTLHRVGKDKAGPIDSMRTDALGRYRFRYQGGDTLSIYFVSSSFGGIAHFTAPLKEKVVNGDAAEVMVFDTTSAPVSITLRGRHLIVTAADSSASRTIIEVFELSNDSTVTRIPGAAERPTFESSLPDRAQEPQAGDGDFGAKSIRFAQGRVQLIAPLAPGVKQFSINYRVPSNAKARKFPVDAATTVLEVLVEDPKGSAAGAGLKETASPTLGGRQFKRFLAQDVKAGATIEVVAPTGGGNGLSMKSIVTATAIGAVGLIMVVINFARRKPGAPSARTVADDPDAIAREIAALDEAFERIEAPTADAKADHYQLRARLKARLTAALARRDGLA
jgi:hypothetical protein